MAGALSAVQIFFDAVGEEFVEPTLFHRGQLTALLLGGFDDITPFEFDGFERALRK